MDSVNGELLDLSNPRYWHQNAQRAVRDVYDALIEIITNADDRYVRLKEKLGRIEIEIERRRRGSSSIVRVRDFADGMTLQDMRTKIKRVGDHRLSGMADGEAVRGTNSRGAKDVAVLGGVVFESIAGDGKYHKCEITAQGRFFARDAATEHARVHRNRLKIAEGTGTVVTICVDPKVTGIPRQENLRENLGRTVALRDILKSAEREVVLQDVSKARSHVMRPPLVEGKERVSTRIKVPGYEGAEAKLVIMRAKEAFEIEPPRFRMGGILVKAKHAIHEATLFAPELERDPHAKWFYGRLSCDYIDHLWNEYDERFCKGLGPTEKNPRYIFDPLRKEGLSKEHPFVDALFKECLKYLRPLVEEERERAETHRARIESESTRRRLRALEKAAAKFMSENQEEDDEPSRDADSASTDSVFERRGFSLNPPFDRIVVGQSHRFWLNVKQESFPELSAGDSVQISCATDEISSRRFDSLELHPNRAGVLRCVWAVKGEKATRATEIRARVGAIPAKSLIEVVEAERDLYRHLTRFCFTRKRYSVRGGSRRSVRLYAPYPDVVRERTPVELSCTDACFKVTGDPVLVPRPELGIAVCKLTLTAKNPDRRALLTARIPEHTAEAEVVSVESLGAGVKIKVEDVDHKNQRYMWRGNVLEIAARHPSLRRYLGPVPPFPGQEEKHFRVLLAEIVADAVCSHLMARKEACLQEEYGELDWDSYYAEYSAMLTRFLPIAHETQVPV